MITAVIVAYASLDVLPECVRSALLSGVDAVVIWDNSSCAETRRYVEDLGDARVTLLSDGTNFGFGAGVNRAVASIEGDSDLLIINPDCEICPEALTTLREKLRAQPSSILGPRMRYPEGKFGIPGGPAPTLLKELLAATELDRLLPVKAREWTLAQFKSRSGVSLRDSIQPGSVIEVDWLSGFCLAMRRTTFDAVSGFDEDFFLYFEDVDFCNRARARGFPVRLVRDASVLHYESTSTGPRRKSKHYRDGMAMYFTKHGGPLQRFIARRLMVL